ncbi:(2Fe-2S) ferredoxin domain-containing protein [Xanthovirga aplysinae]|uniref:(2Fe-2S) ferredoxin domain-containing protein n=1 Tax=Xanthovirga aplysinae TaxID=2529853 RepID=UPI0012BD0CBE|nr:(2Fe-2S) ferredoxin domain-containing protein [Xanthovirga aplysinae]MTI33035.1 (2Fe-2S) ferredoxin domain-containing protein [Xanthovirga aplysinae]
MSKKKEFYGPKKVIYICEGGTCKKKGSKEIYKMYKKGTKVFGIKNDEVEVVRMHCTDRCNFAPVMAFQPENKWCAKVTLGKAEELFKEKILGEENKSSE